MLEHTLQSDPPLPESDIVSLLVTGRTLDEVQDAQGDVARDQLLGNCLATCLVLPGGLSGWIRSDSTRYRSGHSTHRSGIVRGRRGSSTRLTISKHLRRDVEVVLSQNLSESGGLTWIAMYRPRPPVELRFVSRDDNSHAYEFRHTVQFGGGVTSEARPPEEQRTEPDVLDIRFAGDPGFDADTLESALDLDRGDRFDFFTWQRDRDQLEDFFHERGYLEAEVKAGRDPMEDERREQGLALTYFIDRGPRTTLRVEGHALPDSLLDDMRDTWGRSVFDGFLLEDFREATERHLVSEGYFRASIQPEIVRPAPGEKEIVLRVDAGPRSTDTAIVFTGNTELPSDQLLGALGPEARLSAWTNPASIVDLLERFYRSEGFLTADVSIGDPIFSKAAWRGCR